ncbi:MAG: malonic semialdehyde reductase [Alphaproteobacteria bacterium]|nr:malonic semialdehyde reductase [Alphaproteobacteria bacterium]
MNDQDLDLLFRQARTVSAWTDRAVDDRTLRAVFELASLGPTSANCQPARFLFIRTREGKRRLKPFLAPGNVDKTMAAPVTVVVAEDLDFPATLPRLFPHADARSWFEGDDALIQATAFRNATLQAAWAIMAARALGLDCGPMSGFDAKRLDAEFFPTSRIRSTLLINLGHGDPAAQHPRLPRLGFDEACRLM